MDRTRLQVNRCITISFLAFAMLFLQSCGGHPPTAGEISGIWIGAKNAEVDLRPDGTFTAKDIPGVLIYGHGTNREFFGGKGSWKIEKNENFWQVSMEVIEDSLRGERAIGIYYILISGTNGILETRPPWYLFLWLGEEGEARFEFAKKSGRP